MSDVQQPLYNLTVTLKVYYIYGRSFLPVYTTSRLVGTVMPLAATRIDFGRSSFDDADMDDLFFAAYVIDKRFLRFTYSNVFGCLINTER